MKRELREHFRAFEAIVNRLELANLTDSQLIQLAQAEAMIVHAIASYIEVDPGTGLKTPTG